SSHNAGRAGSVASKYAEQRRSPSDTPIGAEPASGVRPDAGSSRRWRSLPWGPLKPAQSARSRKTDAEDPCQYPKKFVLSQPKPPCEPRDLKRRRDRIRCRPPYEPPRRKIRKAPSSAGISQRNASLSTIESVLSPTSSTGNAETRSLYFGQSH